MIDKKCMECGKPIDGHGHGSVISKFGRLCDHCNEHVEIPRRISLSFITKEDK